MMLKPYPKYKESGEQWIGKIPQDWEVSRVKKLVDKNKYYPIGDGDHGSITPEMYLEEGVPYIRVQNLSWQGEILYDGMVYISKEINLANKKSILKPNDLLIAKTGATIGKIGIIPANMPTANTTSSVGKITLNFEQNDVTFWKFYFQSDIFLNEIFTSAYQKSAQPGFNIDELIDFVVIHPNKEEKEKIASFLERKTSEINTLVEKDKQLIELIEEKRTALINHVMTKGLNPKAMMKDSGIEWIGKVPERWEIKKIKHLAGNCSTPVQTGPFGAQLHANDYVDDGIPLILIRNVYDQKISSQDIPRITKEDSERLSMYKLKEGDYVFSRVGTLGRCAIITKNEEGWLISGQMLRLRLKDIRLNLHFIGYILQSKISEDYLSIESVGSTRESLNTEIVMNMPFTLPPLSEQLQIIQYLDKVTLKINKTILKIDAKIELLEEYKKSLIHHVVTGKVDVRGIAQ